MASSTSLSGRHRCGSTKLTSALRDFEPTGRSAAPRSSRNSRRPWKPGSPRRLPPGRRTSWSPGLRLRRQVGSEAEPDKQPRIQLTQQFVVEVDGSRASGKSAFPSWTLGTRGDIPDFRGAHSAVPVGTLPFFFPEFPALKHWAIFRAFPSTSRLGTPIR